MAYYDRLLKLKMLKNSKSILNQLKFMRSFFRLCQYPNQYSMKVLVKNCPERRFGIPFQKNVPQNLTEHLV